MSSMWCWLCALLVDVSAKRRFSKNWRDHDPIFPAMANDSFLLEDTGTSIEASKLLFSDRLHRDDRFYAFEARWFEMMLS